MIRLSKRTRKSLIGLALSLLIVGLGYLTEHNRSVQQFVTSSSPGMYRVIKVQDGDTITIDMDGREERVRMIGVDTPETQDPRKAVQCFGKAATNFTTQLIGTNNVRLEADPINQNRDRYDRLLRYVYLPDGQLVQAEVIKQGYGFAYTSFPFTKLEEFKGYQKQARAEGKGLWRDCAPTENDFGGFTSNDAPVQ